MSKQIIELQDVTVRFNLAMQKQHSLKDYMIRIARKDLRFQEFFALKHLGHIG